MIQNDLQQCSKSNKITFSFFIFFNQKKKKKEKENVYRADTHLGEMKAFSCLKHGIIIYNWRTKNKIKYATIDGVALFAYLFRICIIFL